jgi:phytoene dehydrogenase-like protein
MDVDVVIVGAGHNGLTAAAYLARAGLSVRVLERLDRTGGATVSAQAFSGYGTRVSRYADLVSLMPLRLIDELGLDLALASRPTASYTPVVRDGTPGGLYVEREVGDATRKSFLDLTGSEDDYDAWREFYADVAELARVVSPTLLDPLSTERAISDQVDVGIWRDLVTTPLGAAIERRFTDDTVRGVVASDALIGTFASMHDPSLIQNRCFLYHLIGNGTGERKVPIGGMGAVSDALLRTAVAAGAEIVTGAGVSAIRSGDDASGGAEVTWDDGTGTHTVTARFVLADVAPWVLRILMGEPEDADTKPEGAQLKISFLLDRLPELRSGVDPVLAFSGTLHLNEDYNQLETAYAEAAAGQVPTAIPGQVSCHSLTDPSILGEAGDGLQTLTYLGLHTPARLFDGDPDAATALAVERAIASIDQHLVKPLKKRIARDADGKRCIEVKIPQDLERELAMPGGHIFHGDLEWPWASNRSLLDTPAARWGVQTGGSAVFLCGAGARRGGAVSGLGGHNAAQALLESR